ncbi:MAG: hypothetical protein ABH824_03615 [Nanoarchaeota archaeon]|nr:four helix bundle protein [Nanoarchaeota archaeon]MBU1632381.1 four helix bundle protein [Nanoarchaeota archaeon]MBU1876685.1 four helix bundle protein [Nanoarchaeota archaeon]
MKKSLHLRAKGIAFPFCASAKEVEVLLRLSHDLEYLCEDGYTYLSNRLDELNAKLFLFLRNIEARLKSRRHQFFKKFEEN